MMDNNILCLCQNLSKSYGQKSVLKNCQLKLYKGELVGLIGENGSGKSTFIKSLLGFTNPSSGTVIFNSRIGYCPQKNVLNQSYSVAEHFELVTSIYNQHNEVDPVYTEQLIDQFKLEEFTHTIIQNLSSGTQQKVQFITSIMHRPGLLIMDEPYDGFDWEMYLRFWDVLFELRDLGTGILVISHLIYDRDNFDHILSLENGKLREV